MTIIELLHELYKLYNEPTQGPTGDQFGAKLDELMRKYDKLIREADDGN